MNAARLSGRKCQSQPQEYGRFEKHFDTPTTADTFPPHPAPSPLHFHYPRINVITVHTRRCNVMKFVARRERRQTSLEET